ncbi:GNAT family N-acetyltransferase [Paenibacillus marinisediminis]
MLRLRDPKLDDRDILQLVTTELIPKSNNMIHGEQVKHDLPIRLKRGITFVETDKHDRVIGFVHILVIQHKLIIDLIAVKHDSKRKGIGTRLLAHAESAGRKSYCQSAILLFDLGNEQARLFYERAGYYVTGYLPDFKCYEMEKIL